MATIIVKNDYDGYFERRVKRVLGTMKPGECIFKEIHITAGPWRMFGLTCERKGDAVHMDFYAALRTGFGSLTDKEIAEVLRGEF